MGSKAWLSQVDPKTSLCLDLVRGTRHCHVYRCVVFNFLVSLVAADLGMPSPLTTASLLPDRFPSSGCVFKDAVFLTILFLFLSQILPISSSKRSNFRISHALQHSLLLLNHFYNLRFFLHRGIKLRT